MNYPRRIQEKLEKQISSREIIVLTGMRRVGKTTLMQMIFDKIESDNKVFLDLDNILEQRIFEENDFNNIWANLKTYNITTNEKAYIFLDEIQAMPKVIKVIKYLYDHYDVKFFLTGSSSFYLKNLFPESLSGRKIIFELNALTFDEFLLFQELSISFNDDFSVKAKNKNYISYEKKIKLFEEYLYFGGFPQVVLAENQEQKRLYLKDIFHSYFEMDVRKIADFKNLSAFRDMIFLLMQRTGSKLDITKLASEVGVSRDTVYSYISFLQSTYFLDLVSPFSKNVDREVSGTKKVYFCDTGILNFFARISDGALLENAVFHNLKKYGVPKYYQKRSGLEVDFILLDKKVAFEVKRQAASGDINKLKKTVQSLSLHEAYVISQKYYENQHVILAMDL